MSSGVWVLTQGKPWKILGKGVATATKNYSTKNSRNHPTSKLKILPNDPTMVAMVPWASWFPPGRFSVLSLRLLRLVRRIYWLPRESKATMASFGLLPGVVFLSLGGDPWPKDAKATWGCAQLVDDVSNVSRHQLAAGCKHSFFIPGMMILIDFTNFSGGKTTKRRASRHIKTYQDQEIVTSAVSRQ